MTDAEMGGSADRGLRSVALTVPVLVLLADALFWNAAPGLSPVLFAGAVVGAVALQAGRFPVVAVVLFGLGALPVVEHVQALSLAFLLAGLLGAVAILRLPGATAETFACAALRLLARLPLGGLHRALSALLRLDLYVEVYGLTCLRVRAMICIGLVARAAAAGVATLYACRFVNFAHVIAAQNLTRSGPDVACLCDLGPMAAAAFVPPGRDLRELSSGELSSGELSSGEPRPCGVHRLFNGGWRDWEFRSWRIARYIDQTPSRKVPHVDLDRG
jgi:hypothetical protein